MANTLGVQIGGESNMVPLTPFEQYMLEDDSDAYPMCFFLRLTVAAHFCTKCFRAAVNQTASSHPRFFATIVRRYGRPHWKLATATPVITEHRFGKYEDSRADWQFTVESESCLRISVGNSVPFGEIWLQVHHCCSDARGTLQFLRDVFGRYRHDHVESCNNSDDSQVPIGPPRVEESVLALFHNPRTGCSDRRWQYLNPRSDHWSRIRNFTCRRPLSLVPTADTAAPAKISYRPTFLDRRIPFSADRWRTRQSFTGATLNDGLLKAVFLALRARVLKMNRRSQSVLRIAVPMDQRKSHGRCETAQNHSSMVFLDRRPDQIVASGFLESLSTEMRRIRKYQLSSVFQDTLHFLQRFPFAMRLAAYMSSPAATTVVSNLGILDEQLEVWDGTASSGDRILGDRLSFLVPLRRGTCVAFGIATFRHHLHLSLNYDARILTKSVAQTLLNDTCGHLERFVDRELTSVGGSGKELPLGHASLNGD